MNDDRSSSSYRLQRRENVARRREFGGRAARSGNARRARRRTPRAPRSVRTARDSPAEALGARATGAPRGRLPQGARRRLRALCSSTRTYRTTRAAYPRSSRPAGRTLHRLAYCEGAASRLALRRACSAAANATSRAHGLRGATHEGFRATREGAARAARRAHGRGSHSASRPHTARAAPACRLRGPSLHRTREGQSRWPEKSSRSVLMPWPCVGKGSRRKDGGSRQ